MLDQSLREAEEFINQYQMTTSKGIDENSLRQQKQLDMVIRIMKELLDRSRLLAKAQEEFNRSQQLTANISSELLNEAVQVLLDYYQTKTNSGIEPNDVKRKHNEKLVLQLRFVQEKAKKLKR